MKWVGLACLLCGSAAAETRGYVEAGLAAGAESGMPMTTSSVSGKRIQIGARITPHFGAFIGYRTLGQIDGAEQITGDIGWSESYAGYSDVAIGGRFDYELLPELAAFSEVQLMRGYADHYRETYAANGIGVRLGVILQTDVRWLEGETFGIGAAVSYSRFERSECDAAMTGAINDCLSAWTGADVFLRIAY